MSYICRQSNTHAHSAQKTRKRNCIHHDRQMARVTIAVGTR
jgi:hypothetical protein